MKAKYGEKIEQLEVEISQLEQEYQKLTIFYSANNDKIAVFLNYQNNKYLTREMLVSLQPS